MAKPTLTTVLTAAFVLSASVALVRESWPCVAVVLIVAAILAQRLALQKNAEDEIVALRKMIIGVESRDLTAISNLEARLKVQISGAGAEAQSKLNVLESKVQNLTLGGIGR